MYAGLWRALPGPTAVKTVTALVLFLAVVMVLFLWVFPWLVPMLPFNDVTVESEAAGAVAALPAAAS